MFRIVNYETKRVYVDGFATKKEAETYWTERGKQAIRDNEIFNWLPHYEEY